MVLAWNLDQYLNLTRETQQGQKNLTVTSRRQIMTSSSFFQKMADLSPDSESMVYKSYVFINRNLLSYKNWKQNYKISTTALILLLLTKGTTLPKNDIFLQKKREEANISKINEILVGKKVYFLKLNICVYLGTKFKVSSITLTRFRLLNFDDFNILATDCNKFKSVLTESFFINRNKLILSTMTKSFPLELFDQPIMFQCCPHIETSQLIRCANQLTGSYKRETLALNGLR